MMNPTGSQNKTEQCPYDPSHLIYRIRFQSHLMKCSKHHKNVPLVRCPFNSTHLLNQPELSWHVTICDDRRSYENFKNNLVTASPSAPRPVTVMPNVEVSEDWDNEPDAPSYDPRAYAEAAPVLRLCQNAPPLERKTFRKAEHLRLRKMDD